MTAKKQLIIEEVGINLLKKNPNNPRLIRDANFKKLVTSITEFPEMLKLRPCVVNKDMVILGGNQRHAAAKIAGLKKIYIIRAESLTPAQQKRFIVVDNTGFGEWDLEMINKDWNKSELEDWGMNIDFLSAKPGKTVTFNAKPDTGKWFLNIEFQSESETQKWYDKLEKEGLSVKIIT